MTATMNTSTNGSPRKNLAAQLDRLDQILDGLADGLNDAVASAVQQAVAVAVQEAVRGILAEVLSNADLLAKLRGMVGVTATMANASLAEAPKQSWFKKLATTVSSWLGLGWRSVRNGCALVLSCITCVPSVVKHRWQLVRQFRVPLLTAVVVGTAAGYGAFCGGPYVAAFAGWLAGFTTTLTVQAGMWLRGAIGTDCV